MWKLRLNDLKEMVANEIAIELKDTSIPAKELEVLARSFGKYGSNGALLRHYKTKQLYAVTARNSTLAYYV